MDELEPIPLTGAPVPPAAPGTGRGRRWPSRRWLLAAAAVVAVLVGVGLTQEGPPSPAKRLRNIQAFVGAATSVRFEASHESQTLRTTDPYPAVTFRTEGTLARSGWARWVQHDGDYRNETIESRVGSYRRSAEPRQTLEERLWAFSTAEESSPFAGVAPDTEPDAGYLLATFAGPPLDGLPDRARLERVVGALRDPQRRSGDTIRATLPLAALVRRARFADTLSVVDGSVTVELTTGPRGRLDRMAWKLDARTSGSGPVDRYRYRADVRFTGWNTPVDMSQPALGDVDLTPTIPEEDLAAVDWVEILAPASLPPGVLLTDAFIYEYEDDPGNGCGAVELHYGSRSVFARAHSADPDREPWVTLTMVPAACRNARTGRSDSTPIRPFVAGKYRGSVNAECGDGTCMDVTLVVDRTKVHAVSGLPEPELARLLAGLVPFDLDSTPRLESVPPS